MESLPLIHSPDAHHVTTGNCFPEYMIISRRTSLLFSGMVILVGFHYFTPQYFPGPVSAYIDDLFALPILCTIMLVGQRLVNHRNFIYPAYHVFMIGIIVAILFEVILPRFSTNYTTDILDIMMYGIGGWVYLRAMNR